MAGADPRPMDIPTPGPSWIVILPLTAALTSSSSDRRVATVRKCLPRKRRRCWIVGWAHEPHAFLALLWLA